MTRAWKNDRMFPCDSPTSNFEMFYERDKKKNSATLSPSSLPPPPPFFLSHPCNSSLFNPFLLEDLSMMNKFERERKDTAADAPEWPRGFLWSLTRQRRASLRRSEGGFPLKGNRWVSAAFKTVSSAVIKVPSAGEADDLFKTGKEMENFEIIRRAETRVCMCVRARARRHLHRRYALT